MFRMLAPIAALTLVASPALAATTPGKVAATHKVVVAKPHKVVRHTVKTTTTAKKVS